MSVQNQEEMDQADNSFEQVLIVNKKCPESVQNKKEMNQADSSFEQVLIVGKKRPECSICKKTFSRLGHLNRHKLIHSGEKPYSCQICKKNFTRMEHLTRHLKGHGGKKPFECGTCCKEFSRMEHLKRHVHMRCKAPLDFMQQYANGSIKETFLSSLNLTDKNVSDVRTALFLNGYKSSSDEKIINDDEDIDEIPLTNSETVEEEYYEDNNDSPYDDIQIYEPEIKLECDNDDNGEPISTDETNEDVEGHIPPFEEGHDYESDTYVVSQSQDVRTNDSDQCDQNWPDGASDNKEFALKCNICMKTLYNLSSWNRHKITHIEDKPYCCNICPKKYKRLEHLTRHLNTHSGSKPFDCDVCFKNFSRLDHLYRHKRLSCKALIQLAVQCKESSQNPVETGTTSSNTSDNTPQSLFVSCSSVAFDSKLTNKRDEIAVETIVDNVRDEQSDKDLKYDETSTSGASSQCESGKRKANDFKETIFSCNICMKKFNCLSAMNVHKKVHVGEKPFDCKVCLKKFNRIGLLNKHLKCHNSKRDFECDGCLKQFTRLDHLNRHKRVSCKKYRDSAAKRCEEDPLMNYVNVEFVQT